jgi:uncharacterized protein (TIGR00375 family)
MKVIADLHIHSKYARACSRDLIPENLAVWADKKGITVLGTGDFTHPQWLAELKAALVESEPGLYRLKGGAVTGAQPKVRFMLTTELASIYKQGEKVRRVHNLVFAPNFAAVEKLIAALEARKVNLRSDGRPIMGLSCEELMKICKGVDPETEVIPAHAWTPHFGVFGSLSGFDSLEEAFGSQTAHVFAIETGLSSDPKMNWLVESLDKIALISNSDAHSLRKLGREANVFEIPEKALSYAQIVRTIREHKPREFRETLEFFPEEGKYHLDGHADCKFSCLPAETKKLGGICPVCGKRLLRGVMHRVDDLASAAPEPRAYGFKPQSAIPFRSVIPLEEIIAETLGVGVASKKVLELYESMVAQIPEFELLLETSPEDLIRISSEGGALGGVGAAIAESVMRVRQGKVHIAGGYDGVFGKIQIYSAEERAKMSLKPKQASLF